MKNEAQTKLECLKLAMSLAASKQVPPHQVIPYAMEFFAWVNGPIGSALEAGRDAMVNTDKLEHLRTKFTR